MGSPKGTGREGVEDARLVRLWVGESDDAGRLLLLEVGHQVPVQLVYFQPTGVKYRLMSIINQSMRKSVFWFRTLPIMDQ
jgi:hypothetical protein